MVFVLTSTASFVSWPACDSQPSVCPFDRCSRYSTALPVIPVQLTVLLYRGEWDCLASLLVRYHYFASCEFIWSIHPSDAHPVMCFPGNVLYDLRNWMSVVANAMLGGELLMTHDSLDWNIIQVILIVRLHAMYQQSKKMLIFLVLVFSSVTVTCAVVAIKLSISSELGKL
jgi:hypothetical protein